jgi:hypothetical protein
MRAAPFRGIQIRAFLPLKVVKIDQRRKSRCAGIRGGWDVAQPRSIPKDRPRQEASPRLGPFSWRRWRRHVGYGRQRRYARGFIREMKNRFPDATARATLPPEATGEPARSEPAHTGSVLAIVSVKRAGRRGRARRPHRSVRVLARRAQARLVEGQMLVVSSPPSPRAQ